MSGVKRKRIVVTMEQKLKAIQRLEKGDSVKLISAELGVGASTVRDWRLNKKSIQDYCTQIDSEKVLSSRCTLKKPTNEMVDDALWVWFMQERRKGTPLSGPILKEKALILHSKMGREEEFVASEGWLGRWKKRHGVHYISICGEKLSADQTGGDDWRAKFQDMIKEEGLHPEQVYNMDETGLNFKRLPTKTFAASDEKSAPGFKMSKDRLTVAVCSNASGTHKLPLLVIGKSEKPRAFKNINMLSLPVCYKNQKSAWMDEYIFKDWFVNQFVPRVTKHLKSLKLPLKAILVLDNAPTHPVVQCEDASSIQCLFLPPHVTSIIQPMDQGVIECLKRRYRKKLLLEILSRMETQKMGLIDALKTINIKDVIYMVAQSFDEIPTSTLVKSWRKAWPEIESELENNDNPLMETDSEQVPDDAPGNDNLLSDLQKLPSAQDIEIGDVQEWVVGVDDELGNEEMTDEEIVQAVLNPPQGKEESDDENQDEEEKISHSEGMKALQLAAAYIEQQQEATGVDTMFAKKWQAIAFKKSLEINKQKKITDFFKF